MARPTQWYRATLKSVAYTIVQPEPFRRHVRFLIPENDVSEIRLFDSPEALDVALQNVDAIAQDAQSPLCPSDVTIPLRLEPGQAAIGRCREGVSEVSIIVEYLD